MISRNIACDNEQYTDGLSMNDVIISRTIELKLLYNSKMPNVFFNYLLIDWL